LEIFNLDKKLLGSSFSFVNYIPLLSNLGKINNSKDAFNCVISYNVIENRQTKYPRYQSLRWKTSDFPRESMIETLNNLKEISKNSSRIPYNYIGTLLSNKQIIDIPKKTSKDILLFFTIEGFESLYVLSYDKMDRFREKDVDSIKIPLNKEFEIHVKFQCFKPNYSKSIYYKVIPESWNNITIQKMHY